MIKEDKSVVAPFNLCWQCVVPEVEIVAVEFSAECDFEWDASLLVVDSDIYDQRKEIVKNKCILTSKIEPWIFAGSLNEIEATY